MLPKSLARFTFALSVVASLLITCQIFAGTLDDAPFRAVVPADGWKIAASTVQPMGKNVSLVATISNAKAQLKSVVIKSVLKPTADSSLDELCAGIRDSFANPAVKKISEGDTTFLGHKAKTFVYQVTQGGQISYNEATVFVLDGIGWTIARVGRPDQKDEIRKIIDFYQKKAD